MATRSAGGRRKNQKVITKSHCEVNGATCEQMHAGDVEVVQSSASLIGAGGRSAGARRKAQGLTVTGQGVDLPPRGAYCPKSTVVFLSPTLRSFPPTVEEDAVDDDSQLPLVYPSPRRSHAAADVPTALKIRSVSLYRSKASRPPSSRLRSARLWARGRKAESPTSPRNGGSLDTGASQERASQEGEAPFVVDNTWVRKQGTTLHPYAFKDVPYPVCYDTPALQSDLYADILLSRLRKPSSPTFYDYGHRPPLSVLDLGCGTGLWVLHAAKTWSKHCTRVTGFDVVDLTKGTWPTGEKTKPVYRLVRGNFLLSRLPFENASFDLVRIANLTTSVPYFHWEHLLEEVKRILQPGGRLELIDDELSFPGKRSAEWNQASIDAISFADNCSLYSSESSSGSSSRSRLSALSRSLSGRRSSNNLEPHQVSTQSRGPQFPSPPASRTSFSSFPFPPGTSHTGSFQPSQPHSSFSSRPTSSIGTPSSQPHTSPMLRSDSRCATMESLFTNMLDYHLRIHPSPSEFLLDILCSVFGHGNAELGRMCELYLAPPSSQPPPQLQPEDGYGVYRSPSRASSVSQPRDLPYPFHDFVVATAPKLARRRRQDPDSPNQLSPSPGFIMRERVESDTPISPGGAHPPFTHSSSVPTTGYW